MNQQRPVWPLIIFLAALKFILPLLLQHPVYELQRDEYLYYQQGLHFDLGYLENPPLIAWLGTISSWFGGSEFSIKFWPCLFGAATVVITCLITAELGGKIFAQLLAALGVLSGAYVRVHYLFQPNFLDIFCWTLAVYFLIRYINGRQQRTIFWLLMSLVLGWWSKYSVLFIAIAIVMGLLLSPYRKVLAAKATWRAAVIALLLIIPNLVWQWWFNWPLIHHMEELRDTQLKYLDRTSFLKEQLLQLMPVAILWVAGLAWVIRKKEWRIVGYIYFSVILLLLFGSGKGYYALGVYPMLLAAGAVAWENCSRKFHWIRYAVTILIVVLNGLIMPLLLPTRTPERLEAFYKRIGIEHKWEDQENHPLPQDFADMLGWKELTDKTKKFFYETPVKAGSYIYCRNYGQAGSLCYYSHDEYFNRHVISDNGTFLLWIPGRFFVQDLIYIGREIPGKDDEVFQHFENSTIIDSVTNPYSRQRGDKIIYYQHLDSAGQQLLRTKLAEKRKTYGQ